MVDSLRRDMLRSAVVCGLVYLPGCQSREDNSTEPTDTETTPSVEMATDPSELDGQIRADDDPPEVPTGLRCEDEDTERDWARYSTVEWGNANSHGIDSVDSTVALRIDETDVEYGGTIKITMTNLVDDMLESGNRNKYNVERLTEEGWEEIRVWKMDEWDQDTPPAFTDEALVHDPGRMFEWEFEVTESGFVESHPWETYVDVCPEISNGRYRFVYGGFGNAPSVAVSFDVKK